ncbi:acyl-CoA synthetase [Cylindrospermopsis raciborskii C04]|uniref:Acyl-CoA synthetase n=3 Tax=Cylindrospermopsis raciborskii TaxID=77022 RepID=A0ABX4WKB5_9CYAN|nr:AMP-binding protein [Cylindrospermopsis raciborskii]PNJ93032.1 acyl-CoA synthetase [Cylindrospermopsis raciborskii C03]PNJ93767.1 acyl-CoA synthetase [Cylindrospermopsis raciborskii C04]PNJ94716.1 acyl-CoA synthetase [Cylindrospermopsis raciborskii C07]
MNTMLSTIPANILKQRFVANKLLTAPSGFIGFDAKDINKSITSRFEQQVNKYPDAIAIKTTYETLTYYRFNQRANQLANAILCQRGEKLEVIALLLEKGLDCITGIFGGLKTGKIIVPLDSTFPVDRLAYIMEDAQAVVLITNNQNLPLARKLASRDCQIFNIDEISNHVSTENPHIHILPENPAYIIYTSGSTGKPKGVVQSHINSLHYCMTDTNTLLVSPEDRVIFIYSCSTLGGLLCIFYTLLNGASLYSYDVKKEGLNNLVNYLVREEITIYHSFTTLFRHFVDTLTDDVQFTKIRLVKLGGEATLIRDVENYRKYFANECILYGSLGASEAGTFRNFLIDKGTKIQGSNVPIGYAVDGMEVVLLDDAGVEVQMGNVGEIAIKSKYLTLGYWQKPELTKFAFTSHFQDGDTKIYRTGDLGIMEPDGCLIYMGRKDFQVKIRGFRIEVTEIEMALFQSGNFKEVVVIAREDISQEKRLLAYLVPKHQPAPTTQELRRYLQGKLPEYMIPSAFVFLDALPLTPNGKTDRRALPAPELTKPEITANFEEPIDDIEYQLIQIWEQFLGIKPIRRQDNFFELGGNSLLAVRVFAAMEQKFTQKLSLAFLFPVGTVAAIAEIIRENQNLVNTVRPNFHHSSLVAIQPLGSQPPLFLIHSLGGELLCYRHLAIRLGNEQPVYGLQCQGLDGEKPPLLRVEDMATHYLQEIRTIQPQGPYFIGGYSFGGVVAYEMARQLEKQGEKVSFLAMLDTCRPGYAQRLSFLQRIPLHLRNIIKGGSRYFATKVLGWSKHAQHYLKYYLRVAFELEQKFFNSKHNHKYITIMDANTQALREYKFPIYSGKATLLRTEDEHRGNHLGMKYDHQFGWGDIVTGELDVYHVPGSHLSLLDEPYVGVVAKKLQECLEEVRKS